MRIVPLIHVRKLQPLVFFIHVTKLQFVHQLLNMVIMYKEKQYILVNQKVVVELNVKKQKQFQQIYQIVVSPMVQMLEKLLKMEVIIYQFVLMALPVLQQSWLVQVKKYFPIQQIMYLDLLLVKKPLLPLLRPQ